MSSIFCEPFHSNYMCDIEKKFDNKVTIRESCKDIKLPVDLYNLQIFKRFQYD